MEQAKSPWRTLLLAGCAVMAILGFGVVALVALNWGTLSKKYHAAAEMIGDLRSLHDALVDKYKAEIGVNARRETGIQGSILSISVVNAPFLEGIEPNAPELKDKALEIAATARDILPPAGRYDHYEVRFEKRAGTYASSQRFFFEPGELPPPSSAPPESGPKV